MPEPAFPNQQYMNALGRRVALTSKLQLILESTQQNVDQYLNAGAQSGRITQDAREAVLTFREGDGAATVAVNILTGVTPGVCPPQVEAFTADMRTAEDELRGKYGGTASSIAKLDVGGSPAERQAAHALSSLQGQAAAIAHQATLNAVHDAPEMLQGYAMAILAMERSCAAMELLKPKPGNRLVLASA